MHRLPRGAALVAVVALVSLVVLVSGCGSSPPVVTSPPAVTSAPVAAEVVATVGERTYHRDPLCNASACAGCSADPGSPAVHLWAVDGDGRRVWEWTGCADDAPRIRDLR